MAWPNNAELVVINTSVLKVGAEQIAKRDEVDGVERWSFTFAGFNDLTDENVVEVCDKLLSLVDMNDENDENVVETSSSEENVSNVSNV